MKKGTRKKRTTKSLEDQFDGVEHGYLTPKKGAKRRYTVRPYCACSGVKLPDRTQMTVKEEQVTVSVHGYKSCMIYRIAEGAGRVQGMSTDYTPPADAIEREARALYDLRWQEIAKWDAEENAHLEPYRRMATHVLRERHRREAEAPLVEFIAEAIRIWSQSGTYDRFKELMRKVGPEVLAAHAALDRESEPTLAEAVEAMLESQTWGGPLARLRAEVLALVPQDSASENDVYPIPRDRLRELLIGEHEFSGNVKFARDCADALGAHILALRDRCERQERLLAELRPVVRAALERGAIPGGYCDAWGAKAEALEGQVRALPPQAREWALADEPQGNEGEGA